MDGGYETAVLLATKAIVVLKREMIICVKYTNGQLCKKKKIHVWIHEYHKTSSIFSNVFDFYHHITCNVLNTYFIPSPELHTKNTYSSFWV